MKKLYLYSTLELNQLVQPVYRKLCDNSEFPFELMLYNRLQSSKLQFEGQEESAGFAIR